MAVWLVLIAAALGMSSGAYPKVKAKDIKQLREQLRQIIDDSTFVSLPRATVGGDQPLLASLVRLAFHDCSGRTAKKGKGSTNRCDGCFDFDFFENAGLEEHAFDPLEDLYQTSKSKWFKKMSRADFWMASGFVTYVS